MIHPAQPTSLSYCYDWAGDKQKLLNDESDGSSNMTSPHPTTGVRPKSGQLVPPHSRDPHWGQTAAGTSRLANGADLCKKEQAGGLRAARPRPLMASVCTCTTLSGSDELYRSSQQYLAYIQKQKSAKVEKPARSTDRPAMPMQCRQSDIFRQEVEWIWQFNFKRIGMENYIPAVSSGRSRCRRIHGVCQIPADCIQFYLERNIMVHLVDEHISPTDLSTLLCTIFVRHGSRVLNHQNFSQIAEVVFGTLDPAPPRDYTEDA